MQKVDGSMLGPSAWLWSINVDFLDYLGAYDEVPWMDLHHPPLIEENLPSNLTNDHLPSKDSSQPHWRWQKLHNLWENWPYNHCHSPFQGSQRAHLPLASTWNFLLEGNLSFLKWTQTRSPGWNTTLFLCLLALSLVGGIRLLNSELDLFMEVFDFLHPFASLHTRHLVQWP